MSSIVVNKEQIFMDELIRENARLTVQHEADHQRILALSDLVETLETEAKDNAASGTEALAACGRAQTQARTAEAKLGKSEAMLRRAVADLHFVMAGGDPCKVCTVKCAFGEGTCKPVWRGEEPEETEEAADQ